MPENLPFARSSRRPLRDDLEPEYNPGKAAAYDAFMEGKGDFTKTKVRRGITKAPSASPIGGTRMISPIKFPAKQVVLSGSGQTLNEANQEFARVYEGADQKWKDKYARQAGMTVEPTVVPERKATTVESAAPGTKGSLLSGPTVPTASPTVNYADMSTDDRMRAQGKTNKGGVPVVKAPPSTGPNKQLAPQVQTPSTGPRINKLTGMPFGTLPGDPAYDPSKKPGWAQDQPAMAQSPVTAAKPAYRSSLDDPNNAFSNEAYARTAAAQKEGIAYQDRLKKAVNPPGLRAVGPFKPLDELVRGYRAKGQIQ